MLLIPYFLRFILTIFHQIPEAPRDKYTDSSDVLRLQDKTESVLLIGEMDVASHVTGVMVAVLGHGIENGNKFVVEDFTYSLPAPQKPFKVGKEDLYICLVSDLGLSLKMDDDLQCAKENFEEFIQGCAGKSGAERSRNIVRVIIAGNSISEKARDEEKEYELLTEGGDDEWNRKERAYTIESLKIMDQFLQNLGSSVIVDVMPGPNDATSILMPQQPIHPNLLPESVKLSSVTCVTNPYTAAFNDVIVHGSSGQNVKSMYEMTNIVEAVDILDQTLTWRHTAPSAPDSVPSYPFSSRDPFVVEELPHVYFVGNQKTFNTKLREKDGSKTRIISVPSFQLTRTCILVNLKDLKCEVVAFDS